MSERIGLDEVLRIAALARLALDDGEARAMQAQLGSILDWVATLEALDTSGLAPMHHAVEIPCPMRDDVPRRGLHRDEVLRAAPRSEAGAFAVPRVMEGE